MDRDAAKKIGRSVATYIFKNHDPLIAHPPPAKPGFMRAKETEDILAMYRAGLADGKAPSVRQIAGALSLPKSKVQRTLTESNYNPRRAQSLLNLSVSARGVVELLDRVFPAEGKRLIVLDELIDSTSNSIGEVTHEQFHLIAAEVNQAAVGLQLFLSGLVHPNSHRKLLLIVRGRRLPGAELEQWASEQMRRHASRGRLGLPPRLQITFPYKIFHHPIARDLASVLGMEIRYKQLATWRDFVFATTGGGTRARAEVRYVAFDMPKIASAAANFVRLSTPNVEEMLGNVANWVSEPKDRETAAFLFDTARHLISWDITSFDKLMWWIEETQYRTRLPHLGDRNGEELDQWISSLDRDEDMWHALVRLEQSCQSPAEDPEEELPSFEEMQLYTSEFFEHYENTFLENTDEGDVDYNIEGYIFPVEEDD